MGVLSLNKTKCNLSEIIPKTLEYMTLLVKTRSQKLLYKCSGILPEVLADEERLQQIIFNLLDNASKFTPSGGTIIVETTATQKRAKVSVIDNGHGISEEQLAALFDSSRRYCKMSNGLGLGLSLCKILVELHGGSISVKSKLGTGSRFTFDIPVWKMSL
jgi:signal transduction histidine kinase